jgi:ribosomal protein L19
MDNPVKYSEFQIGDVVRPVNVYDKSQKNLLKNTGIIIRKDEEGQWVSLHPHLDNYEYTTMFPNYKFEKVTWEDLFPPKNFPKFKVGDTVKTNTGIVGVVEKVVISYEMRTIRKSHNYNFSMYEDKLRKVEVKEPKFKSGDFVKDKRGNIFEIKHLIEYPVYLAEVQEGPWKTSKLSYFYNLEESELTKVEKICTWQEVK